MWVKRVLIYLPLALVLLLVQSFFWVPTYDKQGVGNPGRLVRYIQGSIGDAQILNPILSADTSSSSINDLVFDGLIDMDDNLNYRPRLATGWTQYEEAYLTLNPSYRTSGMGSANPEDWVRTIRNKLKSDKAWTDNIQSIDIVPAKKINGTVKLPKKDKDGKLVREKGRPQFIEVDYALDQPVRLKFTLREIDQDFFLPLEKLLGVEYFQNFPFQKYIKAVDPSQQILLESKYSEVLQVAEHNPVIEFELRKGVRFHDGHEFDSGDVLFTYQSIMDPRNASPRRSDYEPIKKAEVPGPYKIRFVYKRLFSPAINAWFMGILPEHLLNRSALKKEAESKNLSAEKMKNLSIRDSDFNRNPLGTGPFIFKEWQGDVMIRLAKNPDYWESPPEYSEYIMRIIPDTLTREMEFYAGSIDQYGVEPHQVARLKTEEKYQNFSSVGYTYNYIGYNMRKPLFKSREIRRALGMAIDTEKIIKYVLYGEGERVTGPYPKITDWYDHNVKPIPYDPEGALRIFNKLGWKKNADGYLEKDGKVFEFNLITNSGNPIRKNILTIAQNNWRKLGIKCNTQLFEWAVFLKDFVNVGKFDALVLGWSMGIDNDLFQIWHSSQAGPQQLNFVGYESPEADRLIVKIRQEYNKARLMEMTHQLHRQIARDQPYTFLFVRKATQLLDKKIVIVERENNGSEKFVKIYPTKDGNIRYYFNKWRKLKSVPQFSAG